MAEKGDLNAKKHRFFGSLLSALVGVGFIALSVRLGVQNDFLATLFIKSGDLLDYFFAISIVGIFILGVVLIAQHVAKEGVAENFYEHTPY